MGAILRIDRSACHHRANLTQEQIARLAYFHWLDCGCRERTAESDWHWAEREWMRRRAVTDLRPGCGLPR